MDPLNELLTLVRGLRNGLLYGTKIRLPHALVMTLLFRQGQVSQKLKSILKVTYEHASKLGTYVVIYKLALKVLEVLQQQASRTERVAPSWHAAVAGAIGATVVWRGYSSVNMQILMYLLGRTLVGAGRALAKEGVWPLTEYTFKEHGFPLLSVATWAAIMYLHHGHKPALQGSLSSSMDFLYNDSETWSSWRDFLPSPSSALVVGVALLNSILQIDIMDKLSEPIDAILSPSHSNSSKSLLWYALPSILAIVGIRRRHTRGYLRFTESGSEENQSATNDGNNTDDQRDAVAITSTSHGNTSTSSKLTQTTLASDVNGGNHHAIVEQSPQSGYKIGNQPPDHAFYSPSPQSGSLLKALEKEGETQTESTTAWAPLPVSPVSSSESGRNSTETYTSSSSPVPVSKTTEPGEDLLERREVI